MEMIGSILYGVVFLVMLGIIIHLYVTNLRLEKENKELESLFIYDPRSKETPIDFDFDLIKNEDSNVDIEILEPIEWPILKEWPVKDPIHIDGKLIIEHMAVRCLGYEPNDLPDYKNHLTHDDKIYIKGFNKGFIGAIGFKSTKR